MALFECPECSKQISNKAKSCPGCGYPIAITSIKSDKIQYSNYDKSEPIICCYNCGYNGSISSEYLVCNGTKAQCPKCKSVLFTSIIENKSIELNNNNKFNEIPALNVNNPNIPIMYQSSNDDTTKAYTFEASDEAILANKQQSYVADPNINSRKKIPEIPIGLYIATAILCFPLGTGIAIGGYLNANRLIKKNDYDKAYKDIANRTLACWLLIIISMIVTILILSNKY